MLVIDQNSAINSLNESLIPNSTLIDGRTEQDWLYFAAEFSKLINFYNDTNTIEGNWNPFLLKDPVFLMASISKTNYKNLYAVYKTICTEIQKQTLNANAGNLNSKALSKLFDHLNAIYKIIESWTHYMQKTNEKYDLKNYILHEVQTKLSIDFWAIQSFRQYLYTSSVNKVFIEPAPVSKFVSFETHLWSINKDKTPFWEVFGFESEQNILNTSETMIAFSLNILTKKADQLFSFLQTVIHHSSDEFKKLSHKKSKFPDTTLLRSFINILKIQQDQLNGISQKHLDFYYRDILKQTKLPALADSTFLCATLAKTDSVYNLPVGTLFNAGVDAQKNPILFASQKNTALNPASIVSANTLCYQPDTSSYNLQSIKATSVQKDPDGKIISWPTFGESNPKASSVPIGIAFASPMLLLREGKRIITLTLEFDSAIYLSFLQKASYLLSTQNDWLKLALDPTVFNINTSLTTVTIEISLAATEAAIEPFLINPDGLKTEWPMLKILFESVPNPVTPPKVLSITIGVKVYEVKTFQLYNDFGELNTKNPFPPFGPIPLENANFIIGNNEIFSKPIDNFITEINWDKRPSDFRTYYKQYNDYLNPGSTDDEKPGVGERFMNFIGARKETVTVDDDDETFSNGSFIVDFNVLEEKSWQELKIYKVDSANGIDVLAPKVDNDNPVFLFDTNEGDPTLPFVTNSSSYYMYSKTTTSASQVVMDHTFLVDPNIQNEPLKFTESSSSGFIKMILSGPEYGFGSEIYPNVVTSIALDNANSLARARGKKDAVFIPSANLPFAPKIKSFSASYSATVTYKFDSTAAEYPLQYFIYTPFSNYQIFDNSDQTNTASTSIAEPNPTVTAGLPLYPSFNYTGGLFIELENLICNSSLNLYFELARNSTAITPGHSVNYSYLNNSGWSQIKPLADETNQFKCSGIITLPIPADCNNNEIYMPGKNNWISIVVSGKPDSYSKTTFLQTNGFSVQRTGTEFLLDTETPQINSGTITKPQNAIPQIATLIQPFASFGGKAAENETNKNQRVSTTIKTKNRVITSSDYYTLIAQQYDSVYYSKIVNKKYKNSCTVYLVKKMDSGNDSNAFIPLASNSLEIDVEDFLKENASPFANITVSNFNMEYVSVTAKIVVESGYQPILIHKNVNDALKLYLSPWINSSAAQTEIDKPLINAKVTTFIQNIEGVALAENVSFSSYYINSKTGIQTVCKKNKATLKAYGPTTLLVSAPDHNITF
ncbi:hypothetical protein [Flavobacterium salmonis]|uniref:Baseplate J-like protein n=1 Tax=Flavobacterium salmonis TaxID=2654844 RepID=A0A6V6ZBF5_9FLAO|nr:hypothetical protein [Flavobacterium salmonis]CAD0009111.1 hypothetical protein FLAT13_04751 [Flavobacterium salmonis]